MPSHRAGESGSSPGARSNYQLGQSVFVRARIEIIGLRASGRGVLYAYGADESFVQHFGELEALREYARQRYPEANVHETLLDGFFEVLPASAPPATAKGGIGCKATV